MEQWRPVPGLDGYEASNIGRVRSLKRGSPRQLAVSLDDWGYRRVSLWVNGAVRSRRVHQLVCAAFHGPRPVGLQARHLNGEQLDNRADNLRWGTPRENMRDRIKHGRHPQRNQERCKANHEFTPENTYQRPGGRRECRACWKPRNDQANAARSQRRAEARTAKAAAHTEQ